MMDLIKQIISAIWDGIGLTLLFFVAMFILFWVLGILDIDISITVTQTEVE